MAQLVWHQSDFVDAGIRLCNTWRLAEEDLRLGTRGFFDIVKAVDNDFKLSDEDIKELRTISEGQYGIVAWMDMRFRKCPKTKHLESPYSVLLEIIEHGGSFSTENGIIDIRDQSSVAVGGFVLQPARIVG